MAIQNKTQSNPSEAMTVFVRHVRRTEVRVSPYVSACPVKSALSSI